MTNHHSSSIIHRAMNSFKLQLLALVCLIGTAHADTYTDSTGNVWTYGIESGGATITQGAINSVGPVSIPSEVGGVPVKRLNRGYSGNIFGDTDDNVTSVTIPASVTNIGDYAFYDCNSLGSVSIASGSKLTVIGSSAFYSCNLLNNINIPESVREIGEYAFSSCIELKNITLPNQLTTLGISAFSSCSALKSIVMPQTLTSIPKSAFSDCYDLATVTISEGIVSIESSAFDDCNSLCSIELPTSLTTLQSGSFSYCYKLTDVIFNGAVPSGLANSDILDYAKNIDCPDEYAEAYRTWLSENGCTSCTVNKSQDLMRTDGTWYYRVANKSAELWRTNELGAAICALVNTTTNGAIILPSELGGFPVKKIGTNALKGLNQITAVTIPSSCESIGDTAFDGCAQLDSVTFEGDAPNVGSNIFKDVPAATTIKGDAYLSDWGNPIPSTWQGHPFVNIGGSYTDSAGTWYFSVSNNTVILLGASSATNNLTIPTKIGKYAVSSIAPSALTNLNTVIHLTVPASCDTIGNYAFSNCTSLASVTFLGNQPTHVGAEIFKTVPAEMIVKADTWIYDWDETNPSTWQGHQLVNIGGAYTESGITWTYSIPEESVIIKGAASAEENGDIVGLTLPQSINGHTVTRIEAYAFTNLTKLTSITIPASCTVIGQSAFAGCTSLRGLTIPENVTYLGKCAFAKCDTLEKVFYLGTTNVRNAVDALYEDAPAELISCALWDGWTADDFGKWKDRRLLTATNGITPTLTTKIDKIAWNYRIVNAEYVEIGDGVSAAIPTTSYGIISIPNDIFGYPVCSIASNAFNGCKYVVGVNLPANVTTVAETAFTGCPLLKTFSVDAGNTSFYADLNDGATLLSFDRTRLVSCAATATSITLPATLTKIAESAFVGCSRLAVIGMQCEEPEADDTILRDTPMGLVINANITGSQLYSWLPYENSAWKNRAFSTTVGQHTDTLDNTWTYVLTNDYAQIKSVALSTSNPQTTLTIPDFADTYAVKSIGIGAFANMRELTAITLPAACESIGDYAFSNCTALATITLNDNLRQIGKRPFFNTAIKEITLPDNLLDMDGNITAGTIYNVAITIPDTSLFSQSEDGYCLYNKDKTRLYACATRAEGSVILPPTLTEIKPDAFYGCYRLSYLNIPANVTKIGEHAFDVSGYWPQLSALESTPKLETVFYQGPSNIAEAAENMYEGTPATLTSYAFSSSWTGSTWKGRPLVVAKNNTTPVMSAEVNGFEWKFHIVNNAYAEIYNEDLAGNPIAAIPTSTAKADNINSYVTIPSSFFGYPVQSIGPSAFEGCNVMSGVLIPSTISEFGSYSFKGCSALSWLNISSIHSAYTIDLPTGIQNLGYRPFSGITKVTKLDIPSTLTSVSNNPIAGCPFITSISIDSENSYFTFESPLLLNSAKTILYACLPNATSISIPDTVKTIVPEAFDGCGLLTEITFLGSAPAIPANGFDGTASDLTVYANTNTTANWSTALANEPWLSLASGHFINMGDDGSGATYKDGDGNVWSYAISSGTATLTGVTRTDEQAILAVSLPQNIGKYVVKGIGTAALADLCGITTIAIPNTYDSIGDYAFSNCTALGSVTLNSAMKSLGKAPFYGTAIASLALPNTLTSIDGNPFVGCAYLTSITVDADNPAFSASGNLLLSKDGTILYACLPGATEVTLPATIETIVPNAFAGCTRLTTVTALCDEPTVAGNDLFADAPNVTIEADAYALDWGEPIPATWQGRTFSNTGTNPDGIIVTTENGWTGLTDDGALTLTRIPTDATGDIEIPTSITVSDEVGARAVTKIASGAFLNCASVTSISIPAHVTEIAADAFIGCTSLAKFTVDSANTAYATVNGVLYSKDLKTLVKVPAAFAFAAQATMITTTTQQQIVETAMHFESGTLIPAQVTESGSATTSTATSQQIFTPTITAETILQNVTTIADYAFSDCGYLTAGTTVNGTLTTVANGQTSSQTGAIVLPFGTTADEATTTRATNIVSVSVIDGLPVTTKILTTESTSSTIYEPRPDIGSRICAAHAWDNSFWASSLYTEIDTTPTTDDTSTDNTSTDSDSTKGSTTDTPTPIADPATLIAANGVSLAIAGGVSQTIETGLDSTAVKTVKAKGLPTGLKLVKTTDRSTGITTWTIQGLGKKAQTKTVTLTITNKDNTKEVRTFTITTSALPTWLTGEFNGGIYSTAGSVIGSTTAKITTAGKLSGKLLMPSADGTKAKSYAFTMKNFSAYDESTATYSGTATVKISSQTRAIAVTCRLDSDGTGLLTIDLGSEGSAVLVQNIWKRKDLSAPAYAVGSTVVKEGFTFKYGTNGKVKWSGKITNDAGTLIKVSGSSQLLNDTTSLILYVPPKRNLVGGRAAEVNLGAN